MSNLPPVELPSLRGFLGAIALTKTTSRTTNRSLKKLQGGQTTNDIDVRDVVNAAVDALDAAALEVMGESALYVESDADPIELTEEQSKSKAIGIGGAPVTTLSLVLHYTARGLRVVKNECGQSIELTIAVDPEYEGEPYIPSPVTIAADETKLVVIDAAGNLSQIETTPTAPTFTAVTVSGLTASRYVVTDGAKALASQTGIPLADLGNSGGSAGDLARWNGANWVRFAAPANGTYSLQWAGGVPSWVSAFDKASPGTIGGTTPGVGIFSEAYASRVVINGAAIVAYSGDPENVFYEEIGSIAVNTSTGEAYVKQSSSSYATDWKRFARAEELVGYVSAGSRRSATDSSTLGQYFVSEAVGATTFANGGAESVAAATIATGAVQSGHLCDPLAVNPSAIAISSARITTAAAAHQPASAITVSFWIMPRGTGLSWLVLKPSNSSWSSPFVEIAAKLVTASTRVEFEVRNVSATNAVATAANDLVLYRWTHVACTYDSALGSNQIKVYYNGILQGQGTLTGNIRYQNNQPWSFGAHNSNGEYFNGLMADVRIENVARSQSYLAALAAKAWLL